MKFEQYVELNKQIAEGYKMIDFRNKYILNCQNLQYRLILNYYRWISVRYYRSLDGKDELASDELFNWLKEEYDSLFVHVSVMLKNESDLIHKGNMLSDVNMLSRELLCLAKMVPDSICSVEETKVKILAELAELVKKAINKNEVKTLAEKLKVRLSEPSEWFNADIEFVVNTTDRTIFDRYDADESKIIQVPEILM